MLAAILLHYGNRVIVLVMSVLVSWEAENLPPVILQQISEWAEIELYEIAPTIAAHVVGVVGWGSVLSLFLIATAGVGGILAGSRRFPASLQVNGQNPLRLLHKSLSVYIHDKSDEECLQLAKDIRVVLTELADRIGQALKDKNELDEAVKRLMGSTQKKKKKTDKGSDSDSNRKEPTN